MKISKAKRKEHKKIAKIYQEGFSEPPFNEPWTKEKALKKIRIYSKYCDIWSVKEEKELIGFIIINPTQWCPGEIIFGEEMSIKKEFRKQGFATKVLKEIFKIYKNKGYRKYFGIVNKKSNSFGLHNKIGCVKSESDFIMEKNLK